MDGSSPTPDRSQSAPAAGDPPVGGPVEQESAPETEEWEPDEFVVERGGYGVGTDI